jgi:AcrR family transcriptional regulator
MEQVAALRYDVRLDRIGHALHSGKQWRPLERCQANWKWKSGSATVVEVKPNPTTERPLRADAQRNREKILKAGRTIFAAEGPDAQMPDVAARAGVGLGTVYRHFPTKAALAAELVAESLDRYAEIGRAAIEADNSSRVAVETAVTAILEDIEGDAGVRFAVAQFHLDTWRVIDPRRATLLAIYQQLIDSAQADGVLREDFNAVDLEMVMRGVCLSMSGYSVDSLPVEMDWRRQLSFVLDGIWRKSADAT